MTILPVDWLKMLKTAATGALSPSPSFLTN